jgi:hypothetical protein
MTVKSSVEGNDILYKNWHLQLPIDCFFADMDVLTCLLIPQSNFGHDMVIIYRDCIYSLKMDCPKRIPNEPAGTLLAGSVTTKVPGDIP